MKKLLSSMLTVFMLMSLFCVVGFAYDECDIHIDMNFDDYCDSCNQYAMSSESGLNATAVISDGVLVVIVYNSGVKNFSSIDTDLHYNPDKLTFYGVEYNPDGAIAHAGANHGNFITASFAAYNNEDFPEDEVFVLYLATFIINGEFGPDDIPELVLRTQDDVSMYSSDIYKSNNVICFDTTHVHIDENDDAVCDICSVELVVIGDVNYDGKLTASDARLALRIAANLEETTEYVIYVADFDANGRITASEARKILRVSAKIDSF